MVNKLKEQNLKFWTMLIGMSPFFKLLSVASWLNSIRNIIPEADRVISLLNNASAKHLSGSSKKLIPYFLINYLFFFPLHHLLELYINKVMVL